MRSNLPLAGTAAAAILAAGGHVVQVRADTDPTAEVLKQIGAFKETFTQFQEATKTADAAAMAAVEATGKDVAHLTTDATAAAETVAGLAQALTDMEQKFADQLSDGQHVPAATMGDIFTNSAEYKALSLKIGQVPESGWSLRIEANTITGQGGSPVENVDTLVPTDRRSDITPGAFRALRIVDLLNTVPTNSNAWQFVRELLWTNSAAEVAEGAAKAESVLTFEDATVNVRTIAHFLKASNQILADAPALKAYIDGRLRHGVDMREDTQLVAGNGTGQNISGMITSGNFTAHAPVTGDTQLDTLNKCKYALIAAEYQADGVLMNPADWGAIERLKTSDLAYLVGNPFGQIVPMVWGLPVVVSNAMTSGSYLMADFATSYDHILRQGTVIDVGFVGDDFTKNLVTIRAEKRAALATVRPASAFFGALTV